MAGRRVAAILLGAGAGSRMRGADKLLELVEGVPLLRRGAEAALAGGAAEVVVVIPPDAPARRATLAGLPVKIVEAAEHAEGMAASLRAGLAAVSPRAEAVLVLLGDMPEIGPGEIGAVIAAFGAGGDICRAVSAAGVPGHPVLFGRRHFGGLAALRGDAGARELLRGADVVLVPTGGACVTDLDTPEDWARWRARS